MVKVYSMNLKKSFKAKKMFVVVAYDISNTKRRNKIAKLLGHYGSRVNLSVFECLLTKSRFEKLRYEIEPLVEVVTDNIVYYTICFDCFTKIQTYPEIKRDTTQTVVA